MVWHTTKIIIDNHRVGVFGGFFCLIIYWWWRVMQKPLLLDYPLLACNLLAISTFLYDHKTVSKWRREASTVCPEEFNWKMKILTFATNTWIIFDLIYWGFKICFEMQSSSHFHISIWPQNCFKVKKRSFHSMPRGV